jgi:hypothetical protein
MIDLLESIHSGKVTDDQAYDIIDDFVIKFHEGEYEIQPKELLKLNNYEWTAFCQGVDLNVLASWRMFGWPKKCCSCGQTINYREYNWIIHDEKELMGLNCC